MDEETLEEIKKYYKLKKLYEKRINDKKKNIMRNESLTEKEKKQKFMQLVPTCVNCKKPGGTTFKIIPEDEKSGPYLVALCNASKPCKLNIKIDRGRWYNIRTSEEKTSDKVKNLQTEIIGTKLNLLFNLVDEETAMKNFDEIKSNLKFWNNSLVKLKEKYIYITKNPETIAELNEMQEELLLNIKELEDKRKKYDLEKTPEIIKEMVEIYTSKIKPLVNDIRYNQYKYSGIETDSEHNHHLIQLPYTLQELYIKK